MSNLFLINSENPTLKMHECGQNQYWFYHKGSYPNDSPQLFQELVDSSTSEIIIWDPYFNIKPPDADQNIFANIQDDITIKILTYKGLDGTQTYLTEVKNALKMVISPLKDCRFGLRVVNKGDIANQGERFFHDRFLIIDNSEVFLIGSSVGHHLTVKQSTGILKISNIDTKEFIKSIFYYYWNNSTQHQIPLMYLHI